MRSNLERKRTLAHRRAPGDNDELAAMQSGELAIEITEARRQAEHHVAVVALLELLNEARDRDADRLRLADHCLLGDRQHQGLRLVHALHDGAGAARELADLA